MVAGPLVAQGAVDQDEIGRWRLLHDLPRRRHADEKAASRDKELLGDEHREGGAHSAADDAQAFSRMLEFIQIGMVARPTERPTGPPGLDEHAYDVAVRIEDADLRHCSIGQVLLPPRLA